MIEISVSSVSSCSVLFRVLLVTMGGPRNLAEVKAYLRRVFSDPYIVAGGAAKRWLLSRLIARAATPKSRARYALIGDKSNAVEDAERLARQLTEAFVDRRIPLQCAVATRYGTPSIEEGLAALAGTPARTSSEDYAGPCHPSEGWMTGGADRPVTPVYLFPHETSAMTGSCADVLGRAAAKLGVAVDAGVRHLGATEAYVAGWADAIRQVVGEPRETFVLFSCHSLPLTIVGRGDPYVGEVQHSVERIQACLGDLASGLAYQSQEGSDWLGPTVAAAAAAAYGRGFRELIVAPLSFVGENTETLVDLDRDLREAALAMGFRRFERLSTPDRLGFLCAMVVEGLRREWGLER